MINVRKDGIITSTEHNCKKCGCYTMLGYFIDEPMNWCPNKKCPDYGKLGFPIKEELCEKGLS